MNTTTSFRFPKKQTLLSHESLKHHCVTTLKTLNPHITCLAVLDNHLYAASVNLINVFLLSDCTHVDAFNDNPNSGFVKSIALSDAKIFTAHQDCKIPVWLMTPSKRHRLVLTLPTTRDLLRRFMLPSSYVKVRRHKRRLWIQHCDTISGLAGYGRLMYSVSCDKRFKIWDVSDYRCLESVKAHEDAINAVAVSDEGTVYTASADGCVRVWERDEKVKRHKLVNTLEKQRSTVNALALNGDGTVLFSGGCDGVISVWERKRGDAKSIFFVERLCDHGGAILCLMKVEDLLASVSADQTVRIWQRERGSGSGGYSCRALLGGHKKAIKSLVGFSGSGGESKSDSVITLFSGSLDGEIRVWEVFGSNQLY